MGKQLKLRLHMAQSHVISGFTKKEVKLVQIALLQSLPGHVGLHTGMKVLNFPSIELNDGCFYHIAECE